MGFILRRPMADRSTYLGPFFSSVVLLVGCGGEGSGDAAGATGSGAQAQSAPRPARPVVTANPTPHPFPRLVVLNGTLEPRESVQIASRVEGPVVSVLADLGDRVTRGRPLATISSSEFRARLAEANAELSQARSDLERLEGVDDPDVVSRQEVEQARTKSTTAEAARQVAAQNLRDARVLAPFDGTVAHRYVSPGAFARVGDPLFDFVSNGPMRLVLEVPEPHVHDVTVGTKVVVRPDGARGDGFDAEIVRVAPAIAAATRTFRVEASVDPHDGLLRPGMFVLGTITLGMAEDAFELPRAAVYSVLGQDRVTLVADGVAEPRDVELIGERGSNAYVTGLDASDVVVVRGGGGIAPGTPVTAERAAAPDSAPADEGR
jgi:membrane fusion protein, multidrug efflux system